MNETSNLSSLFENQPLIKEVKFLVTSTNISVTTLSHMFTNCSNLKTVDFGNYTLEGVTDLSYIFDACTNLKDVTFSKDTSTLSLTNVEGMFSRCESLTNIDLSPMQFNNVENAKNVFYGAKKLTTFKGDFNLKKCKYISGFFEGCESLTEVDLSKFKTSELLEDASSLFKDCTALKSLNLTGFVFGPNCEVKGMFSGCSALKEIDLSKAMIPPLINYTKMFEGLSLTKSLIIHVEGTTMPKAFYDLKKKRNC